MIRLISVAFVLAVATSAQAMSPAPLHQPDGMTKQARQLPKCDSKGIWTMGIGHTASAGPPDPSQMPRGRRMPLSGVTQGGVGKLAKRSSRLHRSALKRLAQMRQDARGGVNPLSG